MRLDYIITRRNTRADLNHFLLLRHLVILSERLENVYFTIPKGAAAYIQSTRVLKDTASNARYN
jgi:hypothetical protein